MATFPNVTERIRLALLEDLGAAGDVTSNALVPAERVCSGIYLAKADGVVSGVAVLPLVFAQISELLGLPPSSISVDVIKPDGSVVAKGEIVARVAGPARALLAGERVSLNLLCHLSGVATQTNSFARRIAHTKARVLDTRKTTPLWRDLEKAAVVHGGGVNHRHGLHDMILIKDNHLALWGASDPAGAVVAAQRAYPHLHVEVEVVDLAGLQHVCANAQPQMVLLDNFSVANLRAAVLWCEDFFSAGEQKLRRPLLEASGNVNSETLVPIAETGVDRISIGALTHSVKALDLSLELKF